ncbi:TonB-dependent receptor [Caulobacter sp. CCUG 60055]|nr:TonB-dependent receptor [Caulobacter sp. CCUG 60055]MBQ1541444.1 TonB-dependent receptor [Caulobacteraceae bacterium]MCI3182237.1 TonB-dependent receptor [Caulobacter sp. CCUG 60055]
MSKTRLLASAAFAALGLCAAPALAAETAADAAATTAGAANVEEIVVYGRGETRQIQTIKADDIQAFTPGTSPIKVLSKLPSVNFQSADPFGAYEWSARISIRGFNQNQLGFTLDDVPLGDMSYGNYNGLHISRAISSENIGRVDLAQGTGGLDTASTSNLGGAVKFVSVAPAEKFGVLAAVTGGSDNTIHAFARLDTGVLQTGGRGYLSYGYQNADKWKGDGVQKQQQVNAKFVQPVGPATVTGWINYSDRRENDYQDLSLALIKRVGYNLDNISNNWPLAVQIADVANNRGDTGAPVSNPAAGTVYPAPYTTVDDVYYNAAGLRKDTIGGVTVEWPINENLRLKATGYGHHNEGQGLWFTPYVPSPGGGPISLRTTEYEINRAGVIAALTYTLGQHTLEGGFWYENNDFNQARRFYGLTRAAPNRSSTSFQSNPFATQWEYDFNTKTYQFHLQDTWRITETLKTNFGFKSMKVENEATGVQGATISGSIDVSEGFLPQVGFNWAVGGGGEVFGDYARNARAFVSAATAGPFSTSQAGFNAIKDKLKPETSDTFEVGYRFHAGDFEGVLAAYYVSFDNRLLAITVGSGIQGNPSALQNVGSVTAKGLEAAGTWRFAPDWSLFGSYAYSNSQYDDDTKNGDGVVVAPTAGKTTVDTPDNLVKAELRYDNGSFFAQAGVNYMGKRYYTYLNDASVKAQTLVDLSLGYRIHGMSPWLDGLEAQLNVTNLFDKRYVSTIGSNGFVNSDPNGAFQTLLAGAPRQAFVTLKKQF